MARCLVSMASMAMPPWRFRLVGTPYLYEVPGATVPQVINAPGVLRPSQGEPQADPGRMAMEGEGEGISEEIWCFEKIVWVGLEASSYNFFSVQFAWVYFFCRGGPLFFFGCVSSVSAWSLFAGYSTADR